MSIEGRGSGGGGCCIARYGHHGPNYYHTSTYDMSKMDQIMLRFRPIAPKPVVGGPTSNDAVKTSTSAGKPKRRNGGSSGSKVAATNNGSTKRRKSRSPEDERERSDGSNGEKSCHVVTLPLLPETPDLSPRSHDQDRPRPSPTMWLSFGSSDHDDQIAPDVVGSTVIVEGVTDTWVAGTACGAVVLDEERRRRLEEDTCPGFVSDAWNRVWWTNEAYRRMVAGEVGRAAVVVVRLGMREKMELPTTADAFTCRVKVQSGRKEGTNPNPMTVPCDVWRLHGGGFAWRLDIKAALSLGR